MKVQNNVNLNTKAPAFRANAVEIFEHGLAELGQVVQRADLVEVAQGARNALLNVPGADSFQIGRHIEIVEPAKIPTDFFNTSPPIPSFPNVSVTEDVAVTAKRTFANPNPPRKGFFGFFVNLANAFIYPITRTAVRRIPGAKATVEALRKAGEDAAAELAELAKA